MNEHRAGRLFALKRSSDNFIEPADLCFPGLFESDNQMAVRTHFTLWSLTDFLPSEKIVLERAQGWHFPRVHDLISATRKSNELRR
jgi:hypothetical protein